MAETRDVLIKIDIDRKGADRGLKSVKTKSDQATKGLKGTQTQAKDTGKSLTSLGGDAKFFGVSVNSLSAGFASMRAVVVKTILTLKVFKTALISTGIGALIIAVGSLIVFFTRMQSGMDIVSKAMAQLGAVVDVVLDRMANLGKVIIGFGTAVVKALKGDFVGAMDAAKEAGGELKEIFAGIGEEIAEDVRLAGELADALVVLKQAEIDFIVPLAKARKAIAQQLLDSKELEKSAKRRLFAVELAGILEVALLEKQLALQRETVRIKKEDFDRAISDRDVEEKALREAEAKLFQIEEASLKKRASIAAQVEKFTRLVAKEEKEVAEERAIRLRDEELEKQINHELALRRPDEELTAFKLASIEKVEVNQEQLDAIDAQNERQGAVNIRRAEDIAEIEKAIEEQKQAALLGFITAGLASQKELGKIGAKFNQGLAIKEIGISTSEAIAKANADIPFPLSLIVGGFYLALGIAQAAAVAGIQFAKGGVVPGKGRAPRTGDHVRINANPGEVILNDSQQAALGGASTFRKIGVPGFQGGGVVPGANIAVPTGVEVSNLDSINDSLSKMKIVVTVEDINTGQQRAELVDERAVI